jgi:hypothetical protein
LRKGGGDVKWFQIQVVFGGSARAGPVIQVLPDGVQTLTADETSTPRPRGARGTLKTGESAFRG